MQYFVMKKFSLSIYPEPFTTCSHKALGKEVLQEKKISKPKVFGK
jgi:hypothetical protein